MNTNIQNPQISFIALSSINLLTTPYLLFMPSSLSKKQTNKQSTENNNNKNQIQTKVSSLIQNKVE